MKDDSDTISAQLSAYLDGQLTPRQRERVEKALAADEGLRAQLEALSSTRRLLQGLPREPAPPELAEAVLARVERERLLRQGEQAAPARSLGWLRYAAAAAAVVVAAGLGLHLYSIMQNGSLRTDSPPGETPLARKLPEPRGEQELRDDKHVAPAPMATYRLAKEAEPSARAGAEQADERRLGEGDGASPDAVAALPPAALPPAPSVAGAPVERQLKDSLAEPDAKLARSQDRAGEPRAEQTVLLNSFNVSRTNAEVYAVLARNNVVVEQAPAHAPATASKAEDPRANVAVARQASPDTHRIVVYAEESQARAIVSQLRQIRADLADRPIVNQSGAGFAGAVSALGGPAESSERSEHLSQAAPNAPSVGRALSAPRRQEVLDQLASRPAKMAPRGRAAQVTPLESGRLSVPMQQIPVPSAGLPAPAIQMPAPPAMQAQPSAPTGHPSASAPAWRGGAMALTAMEPVEPPQRPAGLGITQDRMSPSTMPSQVPPLRLQRLVVEVQRVSPPSAAKTGPAPASAPRP